jgi:hypothetical protein
MAIPSVQKLHRSIAAIAETAAMARTITMRFLACAAVAVGLTLFVGVSAAQADDSVAAAQEAFDKAQDSWQAAHNLAFSLQADNNAKTANGTLTQADTTALKTAQGNESAAWDEMARKRAELDAAKEAEAKSGTAANADSPNQTPGQAAGGAPEQTGQGGGGGSSGSQTSANDAQPKLDPVKLFLDAVDKSLAKDEQNKEQAATGLNSVLDNAQHGDPNSPVTAYEKEVLGRLKQELDQENSAQPANGAQGNNSSPQNTTTQKPDAQKPAAAPPNPAPAKLPEKQATKPEPSRNCTSYASAKECAQLEDLLRNGLK